MSLSIALLRRQTQPHSHVSQHGGDLPEQDIMQVRPFDCCWGVMRHGADNALASSASSSVPATSAAARSGRQSLEALIGFQGLMLTWVSETRTS